MGFSFQIISYFAVVYVNLLFYNVDIHQAIIALTFLLVIVKLHVYYTQL